MDTPEMSPNFYSRYLSEKEAKATNKIIRDFMKRYAANSGKPVEEWLSAELHKQLPSYSQEEIRKVTQEIITSLEITESKKQEMQKAIQSGRSKESWVASSLKQATSHMTTQESTVYYHKLDEVLTQANKEMLDVITTQSGAVSQNPHLDGFIAEQAQVNAFNMNAAAKGSNLRAEVLKPTPGQTYSKNSVDVVIKDGAGKLVHRYQMKYGATPDITIQMIKDGNYNNQILVVPAEQVEAVQAAFPGKTVQSTIEAEGITGASLTKDDVKFAQEKAQAGLSLDTDWSAYSTSDLVKGIGSNVAYAGLQGAAIGAGMTVVSKIWNDEPIDGGEVVETALKTGADFGVKAAVAGGLKVAAEKGVLSCLRGTPAGTFANIAFVAIENVKVLGKVATGELTPREGLDAMGQTTGACVAGIAAMGAGVKSGALIGGIIGGSIPIVGTVLGPVGALVGGVVGGAVGYMAGSKVGETIVRGAQKVGKAVMSTIKSGVKKVAETAGNLWQSAKSLFSGIFA